ncbi:hypothetical protein RB653_006013 [Dictyostelium firmibasis]|uniref:Saposin B-type domain-containing protein n=1 Tax=Dictyostelium firmibasis TaxID=79012 RepID=A0AAN7U925_9MYCE
MKVFNLYFAVIFVFLFFGNLIDAKYIGCETCETLMTSLKNMTPKIATREEITENVISLCNSLPVLNGRCKIIVALYGETFIDAIVNGETPLETCKFLSECN